MKKIGIITHYYNSINYGGNLQAYALCKYLTDMGYNTEQISYIRNREGSQPQTVKKILSKVFNPRRFCEYVLYKSADMMLKSKLQQRREMINRFNKEKIPHSEKVFTNENICECNDYDIYITGSDQVWNFDWYRPAFFLNFVPAGKKKIAYAASLGKSKISKEHCSLISDYLKDFTAVSVRERDAVNLLQPLYHNKVEWLLDPTLLLTQKQWDEICAKRKINQKYIFCYFLGEDKKQRKLAKEFAGKKNLPIVTLAHVKGNFRKCDLFFGDEKIYDVSPSDFISLIKYAEYIITDSFHATVFSNIYEKEFFVFQRSDFVDMNSRVYCLTQLFEVPERFCDTREKMTLAYIEELETIDYSRKHVELETMREQSVNFIECSLNG